jgi:hypothetical protein
MSELDQSAVRYAAARRRPLARLGGARLPRRVHEALAEINAALADDLRDLVTHALKEFDQTLFRNAEQARNNTEQARCFESIRLVRQHESTITDRVLARAESDLAGAPWTSGLSAGEETSPLAAGLSLLDEQVLDEELALQEMASRATIRFSEQLLLLGQRFAVLVASPTLEAEQLPIGPDAVASALGEAAALAHLPLDHRLEFFRIVERQLLARLGLIYGKVNTIFVARRILPNLGLAPRRAPGAPAPGPDKVPAASSKAPAAPDKPDPAPPVAADPQAWAGPTAPASTALAGRFPGPTPDARPMSAFVQPVPASPQSGSLGSPAPSPGAVPTALRPYPSDDAASAPAGPAPEMLAALAQDLARFPGLAGLMRPVVGFPELPLGPTPSDPAEELKLVDTLLGLLEQRRLALGQQIPAASGPGITEQTVQQALSTLQRQRHAVRHAAAPARGGIQALREDLLNQLRAFVPAGQTPQLGAAEQNAIELLEMLFAELSEQHRDAQPVRELLSRLEVPLLRVALRDRSFFSSPAHPARRLLNVISASGRFWVDEHGEDTLLFTRLRAMVDRITRDYDEDLTVFDDLLEDLNGFLGTLARKSEVSEKRHVETARGRERLELARRSAKTAIANLIEGRETAAVVRTLLEQTWTDVLSLTILKHGNDPVELERALSIANRLVDALDPRKPPLDETARTRLEEDLRAGLQQVGYHEDDARLIAERLFDADRAGRDGQPVSLTEIAIKLKSRTRLGGDTEPKPTDGDRSTATPGSAPAGDVTDAATPPPPAPAPLSESEAAIRRHLEQTRFGTWFEFVLPGGRRSRRKLAWFSPVSGRCLFVNARGARAEEMTLDDLARRIGAGDVAVVAAEKEGDVDRAWRRIADSLRRMVGLLPAKPATA